jgi:hypothetical protein
MTALTGVVRGGEDAVRARCGAAGSGCCVARRYGARGHCRLVGALDAGRDDASVVAGGNNFVWLS